MELIDRCTNRIRDLRQSRVASATRAPIAQQSRSKCQHQTICSSFACRYRGVVENSRSPSDEQLAAVFLGDRLEPLDSPARARQALGDLTDLGVL